MPYVNVNGPRLFYEGYGSPEARLMVLIPGLGEQHKGWLEISWRLKNHCRVIAVNPCDAGFSVRASQPCGVVDMANDVASLMGEVGIARGRTWWGSLWVGPSLRSWQAPFLRRCVALCGSPRMTPHSFARGVLCDAPSLDRHGAGIPAAGPCGGSCPQVGCGPIVLGASRLRAVGGRSFGVPV